MNSPSYNFNQSQAVEWNKEQVTTLVSGFYSKPNNFNDDAESNIGMAVFSMLPGLITNLKRGIDNAISSEKIVDDNIKLSIKYTFEKLLEDSFLTLPLRKHYNIASEMKTTVAHINYLRHHIRNDQKFKIGIRHGLLHAMQSKIAYGTGATTCPAIANVFAFLFKENIDNSLIQEHQHKLLETFESNK